ncbi:hypothetical protein [Nonomuraea turcica]|uniref:hypothetical protein n=1 Tax=Nonomuraea sp. G32 TaxID=3067274 RepID=UPI00273B9023|nr:hypothetical protein [Nonomuraea sp. G32]MDP4501033.1 hypothetical protein [Nonomuraea sp. G32]
MIREDKFVISRRPYAVDLSSLRLTEEQGHAGLFWRGRVDAVWFRRRKGVTVACIGILWDSQHERPADAAAFLRAHDDGRYGGDCDGRWDGASYWGNVTLDVQEQHLAILWPMLANYPELPAGWSGWWRF